MNKVVIKYQYWCIAIMVIFFANVACAATAILLDSFEEEPTIIRRSQVSAYSEKQAYTFGGTVFNYNGLFTTTPCVRISIEVPSPFDENVLYSATIGSNTADATTVYITKLNLDMNSTATIGEVLTSENIMVHLFAVGE